MGACDMSGRQETTCGCRNPGLGGDCDGSCTHPPQEPALTDRGWKALYEAAQADAVRFRNALSEAVAVIEDYLSYEHDGDPWREDARIMGEMEINDYQQDGRLARAKELLANG